MVDERLQGASWRKSTYSTGGNACVEVACLDAAVGLRDTKHREAGTVVVSRKAWSAFVTSIVVR